MHTSRSARCEAHLGVDEDTVRLGLVWIQRQVWLKTVEERLKEARTEGGI